MIRSLTVLVLCLLCLSGCEKNPPEDMLENYTSRLSRVLEIQHDLQPAPNVPLFPLRRDRIMPTQEIREGLIDVLNLKQCHLIQLIAERNSSLGKVYSASQKMVYELKFYAAIRRCLETVKQQGTPDPDLVKQLNDIYQIKDQNLSAEIWNGIYTSSEVENNFSIGEKPISLEADGSNSSMLNAYATLATLSDLALNRNTSELPDFIQDIEPLYEKLHRNRSGARIVASLVLITQYLDQASTLIEQRLKQKPVCFNGKISQKAKILQNVFYKYYAGEVQPYMGNVHKHALTWLDLNTKMFKNLTTSGIELSPAVTAYYQRVIQRNSEQSLWSEYESARGRHIEAWQSVLKQCGMMPSREV
ncbi:MAG: DUF3080 family protein [Neptuniibacter sp.]